MKSPTFTVITLGCPRNYVDSQYWVKDFLDRGYEFVYDLKEADIVLINTCGFIRPAVEESIEVILEVERLYKDGQIKDVIIAGCLVARYKDQLRKEFPYAKFLKPISVAKLSSKRLAPFQEGGFAYVKICEGCLKKCSFCTIPSIRGKLSSRKIEDIIREICYYQSLGKSEIVIVGQDTTAYGYDIYNRPSLVRLLKEILCKTSVPWIRVMYAYPSLVSEDLLDLIANEKRIVSYLDVPIQHVDDEVLKKMGRGYDGVYIRDLFKKASDRNISLRTTVIVGFPGENRRAFSNLKKFLSSCKLSRLGVFKYYEEEGTMAAKLPEQIKVSVKNSRYYSIRRLSNEILLKARKELDKKELDVIIDGFLYKENLYLARTYRDGPEVDDVVFVKYNEVRELFSGDIVKVRLDYDLESNELIGELLC